MMYDDLIRCLRYDADASNCCEEAADAIESTSKAYQMMAEAYEAEVTKSRWIPVTERLPEPKRKVLISTEFGGVYYGFMNERKQFITANDQYYDSWCWEPNASHWMPLPEPPKEES